MSCTQSNPMFGLTQGSEKGVNGFAASVSFPDSDVAQSRTLTIRKFKNGIEIMPQTDTNFTGNYKAFFLEESFNYLLGTSKICPDGSGIAFPYQTPITVPSVNPPASIDAKPEADHIAMTVPLNNNYATMVRYRRKGTTPFYNNPLQKVEKFDITPLLPDTDYELLVFQYLPDRVNVTPTVTLTARTKPAVLTNLSTGINYITCTAPITQTGIQVIINGTPIAWYINIGGGTTMSYNIGRVLTVGDVVSISYGGQLVKFPPYKA